jgi:hypothetical protein
LKDLDEKAINISNFKFNEKGFIENPQTNDVLEAGYDNKVKVNTKDTNNRRQLWKKGCPNYKGFFIIEHSESRMLLSVTTNALKSGGEFVKNNNVETQPEYKDLILIQVKDGN